MCVYRIRDGKTGNLKLFFPLFFFFFFFFFLEFVFFKKSSQRRGEKMCVEKFLILKIHQKQQLFFGCSCMCVTSPSR